MSIDAEEIVEEDVTFIINFLNFLYREHWQGEKRLYAAVTLQGYQLEG